MRIAVLVAATLAAGLQAGTYFIFTVGVMPGLALGDDRTYVAANQQFNASFLTGWFLLTFVGLPLLALVATLLHLRGRAAGTAWVAVGFVLAVATVAITGIVHVPLNDAIGAAGPVDAIGDLAAVRAAHESAWVDGNLARTLTSLGSLAALAWALRTSGTSTRGPRPVPATIMG